MILISGKGVEGFKLIRYIQLQEFLHSVLVTKKPVQFSTCCISQTRPIVFLKKLLAVFLTTWHYIHLTTWRPQTPTKTRRRMTTMTTSATTTIITVTTTTTSRKAVSHFFVGGRLQFSLEGGFNALCCYPNVKVEIRDSSQICTTAPIFSKSNYFRQKYLEIPSCAVSLFIYIWVWVEQSQLQLRNLQQKQLLQAGCE